MSLNRNYKASLFLLSLFFLCIFFLFSCIEVKKEHRSTNELIITKVTFSELPEWDVAKIFPARKALEESCKIISKKHFSSVIKLSNILINLETYKIFCGKIKSATNNNELKKLIEANFYPVIIDNPEKETLYTGYIELELKGRLEPSLTEAPNAIPVYKKPNNLFTIDLGLFKEELKNKKIIGIIEDDKFLPAATRKEIETQNLFKDNIIAYIDDPARAYFLHIQGSGRIQLPSGKIISLGYDGDNGKEYFSIGRSLIKEGIISKEKMSMQAIIKWMEDNSEAAIALRHKNERFIFFKERNIFEGPIGSSGAIVTAMHTAAVDKNFLPYHLPLWAEIDNFYNNKAAQKHFNLFVSQDTGSAIKGPTRIDLFLGKGSAAENIAGKLNSNGKLWALIPT